ncbi:WAT1-related protein At5g47470-like isoform X1 [Cucurbita moschata]|uniref:WAT1-related protein n=1 Tax=Cucurbita moschata TaxID=3662 RepID=A0A6J1FGD7_CUCMO|nr:WAT1-related protein At5g47470-like isoform X1 [Cucurbita moschata]
MEDFGIMSGLVAVQFVYAGNSVFMSFLMSLSIDPLTLIIFTTFFTFLIVSPVAVYFERLNWPTKLSLKLISQILLISFGGVTLFQSLFLKGIQLTSPSVATAMPNLAPGLIFVIAWIFRLEKVRLSCIYSKIKILGTFLCVIGAFTMSIMHSTLSDAAANVGWHPADQAFDEQKIVGCVYLVSAVVVLSSVVVLQASTLGDFPTPMSLCAITSLLGVLITVVIHIALYQKLEIGWSYLSVEKLIAYCVLSGTVSGACVSFNGWAMKKRGPVLVSMFSPIGTVCSLVLSVFTLGEPIKIGSLVGMFLMFTGLYFVLWAKRKEGYANRNRPESEFDIDEPLLS